jgi:DNA-directed RNA polymerase subunit beta'
MIDCTLGRILFNEIIPQDLGFVDRSIPENALKLEIDFQCGKKELKQILDRCISVRGTTHTAEVLDNVKALGYKYSTIGALSVSISDMTVPAEKPEILAEAQKQVEYLTKKYRRGFMTDEERYKAVVTTWFDADNKLTKKLIDGLDKYNNIFMMADSGARGSNQQIKQLAGMRGLMADTSGRTIELPIKSNFREGLDVLEYFISAHGARKGLSDTALRTADSGYLTRRLVDVSQELIIREENCIGPEEEVPGMYVEAIMDGRETIESLEERITGRVAAEDYSDEEGNVIVTKNHMITPSRAKQIVNAQHQRVKIRTMLTCKCVNGACSKCYGANLATGQAVQVGEAVGIIAAQSIGEPGTQLTMRTFHAGGVAGDDITQGLPRVEELFEARKPKGLAIISEIAGRVDLKETPEKREIIVTNNETGEAKSYTIPYGARIKVTDGAILEAGDELTEGSVNPHDILAIKGVRAVQDYMMREVQRVYRLQAVDINDKHIEIIVRQMLKKMRINESGDSDYLPGALIDHLDLEIVNKQLAEEGKRLATAEQTLLGITKASLATNSFLSAASFQETTKVLTDAAIKGKIDPLIGLKENVLLGKLIPAGTGLKKYRGLHLDTEIPAEKEAVVEDEYDYSAGFGGTETESVVADDNNILG